MELQELIDDVAGRAASDDPLERLRTAVATQGELALLGDQLLDHYVEAARTAGRSWAQVGEVLGVTRQAAQQRHTGWIGRLARAGKGVGRTTGMFTRFAEDARSAVARSQTVARDLGDGFIGTEHLLLGVLGDPHAPGAELLASLGLTRDGAEASVRAIEHRGPAAQGGRRHIPFRRGAKKALELSLRESLRLGHGRIGSEHIVLALLREGEGPAATVLAEHDVTYEAAEAWVIAHPPSD